MKRSTPSMKQITAAFNSRGRTKLYSWLWAHFDELPPYQKYRVNWPKLTEALNAIPVNAADEKTLTPGMVRKTYERVAKDRAAAGTGAKAPTPTQAPAPVRMPQAFPASPLPDSQTAGRTLEPTSTPPERKPMVLRPARTIGPTELPQDDGSKLPKPLHRIR